MFPVIFNLFHFFFLREALGDRQWVSRTCSESFCFSWCVDSSILFAPVLPLAKHVFKTKQKSIYVQASMAWGCASNSFSFKLPLALWNKINSTAWEICDTHSACMHFACHASNLSQGRENTTTTPVSYPFYRWKECFVQGNTTQNKRTRTCTLMISFANYSSFDFICKLVLLRFFCCSS